MLRPYGMFHLANLNMAVGRTTHPHAAHGPPLLPILHRHSCPMISRHCTCSRPPRSQVPTIQTWDSVTHVQAPLLLQVRTALKRGWRHLLLLHDYWYLCITFPLLNVLCDTLVSTEIAVGTNALAQGKSIRNLDVSILIHIGNTSGLLPDTQLYGRVQNDDSDIHSGSVKCS